MAKNKITYMKLLENIKLHDGTVIEKGTSIRMNYKEGPFFNVEINEGENVKKIFWITEEQAKTSVVRNKVWTKQKFDEHIKDIKESWLEEKKIDASINKNIPIKKRGRPKKIK